MIIICGRTIAEVERDLEMAKRAIATGAPIGVGGATMADVEQAMRGLHTALGEHNAPISNPNYDPCYGCSHWKPNNECEIGYDCEDEDEDTCPECGATCPDWDGECCENCGYGCEDEEEDEYIENLIASAERLGIPKDAIHAWINAWTK